MLCSIISIRQRRGNSAADEEFQIFVRQTLGDQYTPTHLDLNCRPFIDSMKLLAHAADLCNFVTDAERSFIRVRLPKVAASRQHVVARTRFFGNASTLEYTNPHSTATGLHRIRSALWRVGLYLEAFFVPYLSPLNNDHEDVSL